MGLELPPVEKKVCLDLPKDHNGPLFDVMPDTSAKTVGTKLLLAQSYLCEEFEIKPNTQIFANVEFTNFRTEMEGSIYHEPALTGYPGVIIAKSVHSLSSKRQLCTVF